MTLENDLTSFRNSRLSGPPSIPSIDRVFGETINLTPQVTYRKTAASSEAESDGVYTQIIKENLVNGYSHIWGLILGKLSLNKGLSIYGDVSLYTFFKEFNSEQIKIIIDKYSNVNSFFYNTIRGTFSILYKDGLFAPGKWPVPCHELFPTDKGGFFQRFSAVWGQPTKNIIDWMPAEVNSFISFYRNNGDKINSNFDSTIRDIVNLSGDDTVSVRNSLSTLLSKVSVFGSVNHDQYLYGLGYDRNDSVLRPILRKYWPAYDYYITYFQEKIIVPYWDARTQQEEEARKNIIIGVSIAVGYAILTIVTLGATTENLIKSGAKLASDVTKVTVGADVDPSIIQTGIEAVGKGIGSISNSDVKINFDIGAGVKNLGDAIGKGLDTLKTNIDNINFAPPPMPKIDWTPNKETIADVTNKILDESKKIPNLLDTITGNEKPTVEGESKTVKYEENKSTTNVKNDVLLDKDILIKLIAAAAAGLALL